MSTNDKNEATAPGAGTSQKNSVANAETRVVTPSVLKLHPELEGLYTPTDPEEEGILYSNILEYGLLNRIVVTPDLEIVSGKRRWIQLQRLADHHPERFGQIEVEVVDLPKNMVVIHAISLNQQRNKNYIDLSNEIEKLFPLLSPGKGKRAGGKNTIRLLAEIVNVKESTITKLRFIHREAPEVLRVMVNKTMSLSAGHQMAVQVRARKKLAEMQGKKYSPPAKKESTSERLQKDLARYLEEDYPEHANLVESGRLDPMDAFNEVVNNTSPKDRKKPKCECPFCSSQVETDKLNKILSYSSEEIEKMIYDMELRDLMGVNLS